MVALQIEPYPVGSQTMIVSLCFVFVVEGNQKGNNCGERYKSYQWVTFEMVCLSGADDTKGSTPRAAVQVVTLIREAKTNKRRDSVRGDSFIVLVVVG